MVKWVSEFSQDVGRANFQILALHALNDTPYVVAMPNLCLAYNKWGRPNPPYVLFRYDGEAWQRITLTELPSVFITTNVIINNGREEDIERAAAKLGFVPTDAVQSINQSLRQAELRSILRDPVKRGTEGSAVNCEELIRYKGHWIMPMDVQLAAWLTGKSNRSLPLSSFSQELHHDNDNRICTDGWRFLPRHQT